jgi:hypothetical protein
MFDHTLYLNVIKPPAKSHPQIFFVPPQIPLPICTIPTPGLAKRGNLFSAVPYHGVHESAERLGVGGSLTNPVVDSIQPFGNTRREKSVYVYIHFFFQDFLLRHLGSRREDQASGLGRRKGRMSREPCPPPPKLPQNTLR